MIKPFTFRSPAFCVLVPTFMLFLASCQPPISLSPKFSESVRLESRITPCPLQVIAIHDARKSPESLGDIAGRRILQPEIIAWCKSAARAFEMAVDSPSPPSDSVIAIDITILQAHGHSITTSMTATVALQARFTRRGVVLQDKLCRGTQIQINMINGAGEIQSCFDKALKKALQQIYDEALHLCDSQRL
jgi:hypothetical protein